MSDVSEKEQKGRNLQLMLGILVFSLGIFAIDILIPLGVASGVGYVVVIILSLRSRDPRFTWEVAGLASFLVLLGLAFSPHGGIPWMVAANRGLSLFVIWATALLSVHHKAAQQKLETEKSTIDLLHDVSLMASQAPSVEAALEAGVKQVCAFTGWPVGHVYRLDGDQLMPMLTWHLSDAKRFEPFRRLTEGTCFQSGEGLPGWVLSSGEPAWIAVKSMGVDLPRGEVAMQVGLEGAAAFPVFVLDEVAYIFEFFFPEACRADENILQVMTYIGRQFGNAIERRSALEQLNRQSEALEQSLDGIVITDLDGMIEFANSAFAEMHGYRIAELMDRSAAMLHDSEH
jgi:PAS domain-containing protein